MPHLRSEIESQSLCFYVGSETKYTPRTTPTPTPTPTAAPAPTTHIHTYTPGGVEVDAAEHEDALQKKADDDVTEAKHELAEHGVQPAVGPQYGRQQRCVAIG
jgi:hypothetical protein